MPAKEAADMSVEVTAPDNNVLRLGMSSASDRMSFALLKLSINALKTGKFCPIALWFSPSMSWIIFFFSESLSMLCCIVVPHSLGFDGVIW